MKTNPEVILKNLNKAQIEAVINFEGPSLIIAGAGAGKTRVLTHRIAYMLSQGIDPSRIMALTFTNKAADEMKNRIAQMISYKQARHLWMGTFHSIFRKILKNEAQKLGYNENFTIYDTEDSHALIKEIIKLLNLSSDIYNHKTILSRISNAKNNLITYQNYKNNKDLLQSDFRSRMDKFWQIYETYQVRLKQSNAMDFDDLLLNTNILFRDFPDVLQKYQQAFDYILVDEYQDTNYSQYLIIKKLSLQHKNICVVGDDSQSIYSFRGARIENILNFKNDYPNFKLFKLEQNYRSTKTIVNAANSLIEQNNERIPKNIFTENELGEPIEVIKALTDSEEAYIVANLIKKNHNNKNTPYNQIAVLYRTNRQSRTLEDALRRENIPYRIYGGVSFYQRKEIKDVLAYIRLAVNNFDNEALLRIINFPSRGIGPTTIEKILLLSAQHNINIWTLIQNKEILFDLTKTNIVYKIQSFVQLINDISNSINTLSAHEFINYLLEKTHIIEELQKEKNAESNDRIDNIKELVNSIKDFEEEYKNNNEKSPTIIDFLEHVSLLTSIDEENEKNKHQERVTLMTAHSAKGLEFDIVFIVGAEKKLFPLENIYTTDQRHEEEERRLFYVALTRAKKKAYITFCEQRYDFGSLKICSPSPFISEINPEYLKINFKLPPENANFDKRNYITNENIKSAIDLATIEKKIIPLKEISQSSSQDTTNYAFAVGDVVVHNRFGKGVILKLEGEKNNLKAIVDFEINGKKQLLLKYAKLTKI